MTDFKWLWDVMGKQRYRLIVSFVLSIFVSVFTIVNPHISRLVVDDFITGPNALQNIVTDRNRLVFLLLFMIFFNLFKTGLSYFTMMNYEKTSQVVTRNIRVEMYEHIQKQDKEYYKKNNIGDLMTRMTGDLDMIRHSLAWLVKSIIESLTVFVVTTVYLLTISVSLTVSMLILAPGIFYLAYKFSKDVRPKYSRLREKLSTINSLAQENIAANKIVKSFARESHEIEKFNKGSMDYKIANEEAALTWIKYYPYLEVLAQSFTFILMFLGGVQIIQGSLSFGEFAAFSSLIWAISNPMRNIGIIINDLERFYVSVSKIRQLYYAQSKIVKEEYVENPIKLKGKLQFDHVGYRVDNEEILSGINFTVQPGEFVVIMGPTGSGKSTILDLVSRLQDPTVGHILVDGVDIRKYPLDEYRANVAVATQNVVLFSNTIRTNISYGKDRMSDEEVIRVSKDAIAHDFILQTSNQYETVVGERGIGLSGGQRQRIALARALASDRSILLLDDTTSAVDNETEQKILQLLLSDKYTMTKVVVAQRVSTAKFADKIFVLDQGRIVESGTHSELLKKKGFYTKLVEIQESYEEGKTDYGQE